MAAGVFAGDATDRWRLVPTSANGQPGLVVYQRHENGEYQFFVIQVVEIADDSVSRITTFLDPRLMPFFGARQTL